MPKIGQVPAAQMETLKVPGTNFTFSAQKLSQLGASEYTLIGIAVDHSGSTHGFADVLEKALKTVVDACRFSPRADFLMLLVNLFNEHMVELHGYKLLANCNAADYDGKIHSGGGTALYDSSELTIQSVAARAKQLSDQDFTVNAIIFILTDGQDYGSKGTAATVKAAIEAAAKDESLESIMTILVGINLKDRNVKAALDNFHKDAGFTQFVDADITTANGLAKLTGWMSKSISSQSQHIGTGGGSQPITI